MVWRFDGGIIVEGELWRTYSEYCNKCRTLFRRSYNNAGKQVEYCKCGYRVWRKLQGGE